MSKAFHKPTPSVPRHYWLDSDGCWDCPYTHNQKGCTNCKRLKQYNHLKDKANRHHHKQQLRNLT